MQDTCVRSRTYNLVLVVLGIFAPFGRGLLFILVVDQAFMDGLFLFFGRVRLLLGGDCHRANFALNWVYNVRFLLSDDTQKAREYYVCGIDISSYQQKAQRRRLQLSFGSRQRMMYY